MAMEANPIRKIVMLLQDMQKEVEAEGEKEKELYEKFMCYCKGGTENLDAEAADAVARYDAATAQAKVDSAEKAQLDSELVGHKADRAAAKNDLATAMSLRNKEHEAYVKESGEAGENLDAMNSAIPALEKGMGSFLQSSAATSLKNLMGQTQMDGRETILSFLSKDYVPASGQIVGILKNMKDEMEKSIADLVAAEKASEQSFQELSAAKKKEIQAATEAVESKTVRSGQLAVSIVENKGAAADATRELDAAQKFKAELAISCKTKTADWEERSKTRADELVAISEAISVLNDDDALEVFNASAAKKPAVNPVQFLQKSKKVSNKLSKVKVVLQETLKNSSNKAINLLAQAVVSKIKSGEKSGKVDFSVVLKMIDEMVELLKKEQADDEKHKDWCNGEFDSSDDEHKDTTRNLKNLASTISELKDAIQASKDTIAATTQKIADLDKSVAEASAQRQQEHAEFQQFVKMNEAAKQLLFEAKNRLQKFYNPNMYKAPEKRELSENDRIFQNAGGKLEEEVVVGTAAGALAFFQSSVRKVGVLRAAAPEKPQAPEEYGEFKKNTEGSNSVMGLMDLMTAEVAKGLQEGRHDEKVAQRDYDSLTADAKSTRATDVESLNREEGKKATLEGDLQATQQNHTITDEKLAQINGYIADLHQSCDFILTNFEVRREARTNEREGLENAKAVLSGSDYSM